LFRGLRRDDAKRVPSCARGRQTRLRSRGADEPTALAAGTAQRQARRPAGSPERREGEPAARGGQAARAAKATAGGTKPPAARTAKPKPRTARTTAERARGAPPRKVPPAGYAAPTSRPQDPSSSGTAELISTTIQAAGELAQIGMTVARQTLRSMVDRLPKP
jgi:hypothetical protein